MKRLFGYLALAALVLGLSTSSAEAGFLRTILAPGENTFEDQDREAFVDVNGDGKFSVGDVLVGFVRLDDHAPITNGVGSINNRIYAIFSQQVASITQNGTNFDITFVPTTQPGLTIGDLTGVAVPNGIAAVYDSFAPMTNLIETSPGDLDMNDVVNLFDYFKSIQDQGTLQLIAGFREADDFFAAATVGVAGSLIVGNTDLIPTVDNSVSLAGFNAGLSILFQADKSIIFNESVLSSNLTLHQLVIAKGTVGGQGGLTNEFEWSNVNPNVDYDNPGGFGTDADFVVNVTLVPEPASITLIGLSAAAMGGFGYLRRRKAKAVA